MSYGLRVWDASGNLIIDTSTRTGFILGSITVTANTSGSTTHADLNKGDPFYFAAPNSNVPMQAPPNISFSGTTMTYTSNGSGFAGTIFYGIR